MILSAGHSCGVTYVIAIKRGVPISLNILRQNMLNVKLSNVIYTNSTTAYKYTICIE